MSTTDAPTDTRIATSLTAEQAEVVAEVLEPTLLGLIDNALNFKQLHWAVVGPRFKPIHEHLDVLVDQAREYGDMVAEYMSTVGIVPDGRAVRVAADAGNEPPAAAFLDDDEVIADAVQRLQALAKDVRARIPRVADADPGAEDLLIELVRALDTSLWMTSAMR